MARLTVTVSRSRGLVTVTLDGELDRATAIDATDALRAAHRLATHTVVIDAQGITFIDAEGRRSLSTSPGQDRVKVLLLPSHAIRLFDRSVVRSTVESRPDAA